MAASGGAQREKLKKLILLLLPDTREGSRELGTSVVSVITSDSNKNVIWKAA